MLPYAELAQSTAFGIAETGCRQDCKLYNPSSRRYAVLLRGVLRMQRAHLLCRCKGRQPERLIATWLLERCRPAAA